MGETSGSLEGRRGGGNDCGLAGGTGGGRRSRGKAKRKQPSSQTGSNPISRLEQNVGT